MLQYIPNETKAFIALSKMDSTFWPNEECLRCCAGTKAYARCCKLSGLTCTYKVAGPSGTGADDQVVTPCASDGFPLGKYQHDVYIFCNSMKHFE